MLCTFLYCTVIERGLHHPRWISVVVVVVVVVVAVVVVFADSFSS